MCLWIPGLVLGRGCDFVLSSFDESLTFSDFSRPLGKVAFNLLLGVKRNEVVEDHVVLVDGKVVSFVNVLSDG
jgi:hypothetical protein